jgi:hypothetical protein
MLKLKLTKVHFLKIFSIKKKLKVFLLLCLPILTQLSCNTTEPTDDLKPGRRDYTWTLDTLDTQANRIQSIWGSSPNDVWAVGPGGLSANERVWHFDGNAWQPYQQVLPTSPECIYGIDQNNIWIGGSDGKIFRFNGTVWNQVNSIVRSDTSGNWINYIWGDSPQVIYALGRAYLTNEPLPRSFILHFNGSNWKEIYFSPKQLQFFSIRKENNKLFLSGLIKTNTVEPDTLFLYKMENNIVNEIYRNTMDKVAFMNLSQIGDKSYFLIGQDLCEYVNGIFTKVISFSEPMFGYQAYGRSKKDIFLRMKDGLAHYNGDNVEYLFHFSNNYTSILNEPLLLEKEVFFVVHDNLNDYNLILRGKLKD